MDVIIRSITDVLIKQKMQNSFIREFSPSDKKNDKSPEEIARKEETLLKWATKVGMEKQGLKAVELNKQIHALHSEIYKEKSK